jgi:ABC-type uncharacterized transport system involved in gliding motility auxiliary subunit
LQVKEGFLGLAIQYGDKTQSIPFVNRIDDLEYRLASAIRIMTRTSKSVVGITSGLVQSDAPLSIISSELQKTYDVRTISLTDSADFDPNMVTLVLGGTTEGIPPEAAERIRAFFGRGGSALILASGMRMSPQMPFAEPQPVAWNEIMMPFGISVRSDIVYDLAASEVIPVPSQYGAMRVLQKYPFFLRAQSTQRSIVNQDLNYLLLPWSSSIDTTASPDWIYTPLLASSEAAGALTGQTPIMPGRDFPQENLDTRLLALQVSPRSPADSASKGRLIVVGNTYFASDQFAQQAPENIAFVLNAVDWLAEDESLIAIRAKDPRPPTLAFTSSFKRDLAKYGNLVALPLLIALGGTLRMAQRRRLGREPYRPLAGSTAATEAAQ